MHPLIPVMAGGAIGAAARYLAVATLGWRGGWPLGTFAVNLVGGFHALGTLLAVGIMILPAAAARRSARRSLPLSLARSRLSSPAAAARSPTLAPVVAFLACR